MNNKNILLLGITLLVLVSIFSFQVKALDISGQFSSRLGYYEQNNQLVDRERLNLILAESFGLKGGLYLNLETETKLAKISGQNRETTLRLSEAYLDYYTNKIDWRFGKQIISWGSAYQLNPTDYFSPKDMTAIKPFNEKIGVNAIKGIYYGKNRVEVTGVITPFFTSNRISPDYFQKQVKLDSVANTLENLQAGIKITKRGLRGFDLSTSFYHGRDRQPIFRNFSVNPQPPLQMKYPMANHIGLDLVGDLGENDIGFWTELDYSQYEDNNYQGRLQLVTGFAYTFNNNLHLMSQAYHQGGRHQSEEDLQLLVFHLNKPIWQFHSWDANLFYDLINSTYALNPQINYSLTGGAELQLGFTIVQGEKKSNPGYLATLLQDMAYAFLSVSF